VILLNEQFTERAMEDALNGGRSIVHIASHFVFRPGDDSASYMAGKENEAGGYHLTLADFRNDQKINLDDTNLLTLSACETGVSSTASNGREVDGLATTAQLKGARPCFLLCGQ
jgi:CHAT domain-containing protein